MVAVEGKKIPHWVVDFGLGKAGAGDMISGEKLPNLAMSSTRLGPLYGELMMVAWLGYACGFNWNAASECGDGGGSVGVRGIACCRFPEASVKGEYMFCVFK